MRLIRDGGDVWIYRLWHLRAVSVPRCRSCRRYGLIYGLHSWTQTVSGVLVGFFVLVGITNVIFSGKVVSFFVAAGITAVALTVLIPTKRYMRRHPRAREPVTYPPIAELLADGWRVGRY